MRLALDLRRRHDADVRRGPRGGMWAAQRCQPAEQPRRCATPTRVAAGGHALAGGAEQQRHCRGRVDHRDWPGAGTQQRPGRIAPLALLERVSGEPSSQATCVWLSGQCPLAGQPDVSVRERCRTCPGPLRSDRGQLSSLDLCFSPADRSLVDCPDLTTTCQGAAGPAPGGCCLLGGWWHAQRGMPTGPRAPPALPPTAQILSPCLEAQSRRRSVPHSTRAWAGQPPRLHQPPPRPRQPRRPCRPLPRRPCRWCCPPGAHAPHPAWPRR